MHSSSRTSNCAVKWTRVNITMMLGSKGSVTTWRTRTSHYHSWPDIKLWLATSWKIWERGDRDTRPNIPMLTDVWHLPWRQTNKPESPNTRSNPVLDASLILLRFFWPRLWFHPLLLRLFRRIFRRTRYRHLLPHFKNIFRTMLILNTRWSLLPHPLV